VIGVRRQSAKVLAVAAVLAVAVTAAPPHPFQAEAASARGVDVSSWQGPSIDWARVASSGISFAYIRAGEATTADGDFQSNWARAAASGVTPGAYLFFHPEADPIAQANLLLQQLRSVGFTRGDLLPAIDVEITGNQSAATIAAHLQALVSAVHWSIGTPPAIYTAPSWWDGNVRSSAFTADPLWIANWGVGSPSLPANGWGGNSWRVWQYSDAGSVPGISGGVDLDVGGTAPLPYYGLLGAAPPQLPLPAGNVAGVPQPVSDQPGDVDVTWRGTDNRLWSIGYRNEAWAPQATALTGANVATDPSVVSTGKGSIDAFYAGLDGNLWQVTYQGSWYGQGTWQPAVSTGQPLSGASPHAVSVGTGQVDVFWKSPDGRLMLDSLAAGAWSGPTPLATGQFAGDPTAVAMSGGSPEVFWRDPAANLWELDIQPWGWSAPVEIAAGAASDPTAIASGGSVVLFWTGRDGALWRLSKSSGAWSAAVAVIDGSVVGRPAAADSGSGLIALDVTSSQGTLAVSLYTPQSGWVGPQGLGNAIVGSNPTSVAFGGDAVDLFWRSTNGTLMFSAACPGCAAPVVPVFIPPS
jgi:GH25 family lysozyme M1 (1,4-beta-N-acetylmuramidase)